ncbi:hypothetical protein K491DRAFT_585259 [Lophiostoma macrostomum CBS 122681]|uniref:Uncharacterized protein n=1 Tax=Lophiostoma macrostomum CBS 122681 TaxID=1314788 RepID=A0A6A6TV63_9PLEO|nr:hypothetical protein K491DRAFT_585259 [Lophiostoma macrostomum CBS 122681]
MPLIKPPTPLSKPSTPQAASKQVPPFIQCPRPTWVADKSDWLQITSPTHFTNFDICPDCYNASLKPAAYARLISPAPPRPEGVSTRCDFSDLWIRVAWAWLYSQGAPDLTLLGQVADVQDPEGTCPNLAQKESGHEGSEKPSATRTWYCLTDPKTDGLIEDMTVCSDCVSHIYTVAPCLRDIFAAAGCSRQVLATCDLMVPNEARTLKYLDQFINVAEKTMETGTRDVTPLTDFVKKWATVPPCRMFERVQGEKCYTLATQAPEWTICEECYITHVHPLHASSPEPRLLSQISASSHPPPAGFACQLYSPRLQQYFQDAVSTNDLASLRQKIMARDRKLQETMQELERLKMQLAQQNMQIKSHQQMALINQQSALSSSLAWQVSSGWIKPTDFSATNASMSQATQIAIQADMTTASIRQLEKEWADFWE